MLWQQKNTAVATKEHCHGLQKNTAMATKEKCRKNKRTQPWQQRTPLWQGSFVNSTVTKV